MALGSTQPLKDISTKNITWGKGNRCPELSILLSPRHKCLEIWELQPPGTLRACPALYWDCFTCFLSKQNTELNSIINSHAQNTTTFQLNVFN